MVDIFNPYNDRGMLCAKTIKAQYYKSMGNFIRHDGLGSSAVIEIILQIYGLGYTRGNDGKVCKRHSPYISNMVHTLQVAVEIQTSLL